MFKHMKKIFFQQVLNVEQHFIFLYRQSFFFEKS